MAADRSALYAAALLTTIVAAFALIGPPGVEIDAAAPPSPPDAPFTEQTVLAPAPAPIPPILARALDDPDELDTAARGPEAIEYLTIGGRHRPVVAGEVVLVFGPDTPLAAARERLAAADLRLVEYEPALGAARAALPAGETVAAALERVRAEPDLPSPAANALVWAADAGDPLHTLSDSDLDDALETCDGGEANGVVGAADGSGVDPWAPPTQAEIDAATAAQAAEQTSSAIAARQAKAIADAIHPLVAVVDSGVAYRSAVLPYGAFLRARDYDKITTVAGYDFVRDHALALDENQHGTHIASTIIDKAEDKVRILPVKVLDRLAMGTEYRVARGMLFALDRDVDIINLSLTFGLHYVPSPLISDILDRCEERGVLVVAAAGNDGASTIAYPAALRGVLAVGAEHPDHTPFSNRGTALDITAKAGHLPVEDKGLEADTFRIYRPAQPAAVRLTGTSMAAATATGEIVRLMRELGDHGDLPARGTAARLDFIRYVVTQSAKPEGDEPFDPLYGTGKIARKEAKSFGEHLADGDIESPAAPSRRGAAAQVNVLLEDTGPAVRALAVVELQGPDGYPLAGARLFGDWEGSARGTARCTTDTWGRCVIESAPILGGHAGPVLVGLTIQRAITPGSGRLDIRPAQRYHAPRAAQLADLGVTLAHIAAAADIGDDERALLDETDPVTGQPLFCLGSECPTYDPALGGPDDLFRIDHRRIYLATRFDGGQPGPESLLAGRTLLPSYQYRRHGRELQGSGLVLAFDDTFAQSALTAFGDEIELVDDGVRLGSSGPGEPLLWINDVAPDNIAEGTGMMTSGVSIIGYNFNLWTAQLFYAVDVSGSGMMTSGVSITFSASIDYFTYNLALIGATFTTYGSALTDATQPPFAFFDLDHLAP